MLLSPDVATIVLADNDLRTRFVSWTATEIQRISQKKNRVAIFNSLVLKAMGASHSAVLHMKKAHGYFPFTAYLFFRGFVTDKTATKRARSAAADKRDTLLVSVNEDKYPRLHWIDNYAKSYAATSIFIHRDLLQKMYWTAHGMKALPLHQNMSWVAKATGGWLPALPNLQDLLRRASLDHLFSLISNCERLQFDESFSVQRYVIRHPLKPSPISAEEKAHLDMSCDGLRYFQPVEIYPNNIVLRMV